MVSSNTMKNAVKCNSLAWNQHQEAILVITHLVVWLLRGIIRGKKLKIEGDNVLYWRVKKVSQYKSCNVFYHNDHIMNCRAHRTKDSKCNFQFEQHEKALADNVLFTLLSTLLSTGAMADKRAGCAGMGDSCRWWTENLGASKAKKKEKKMKSCEITPSTSVWFGSICSLWTLKGSHCPHLIPSKGQQRCLAVVFMQSIRWARSVSTAKWHMKESWKAICYWSPVYSLTTVYFRNMTLTPSSSTCHINKLKIGFWVYSYIKHQLF